MRARNLVAFSLIGVLGVANILYWGSRTTHSQSMQSGSAMAPASFRIAAIAPASSIHAMRRNLFALRAPVRRPISVARQTVAPPVPALTAQQQATKSAQAEFAQLKCVGVVFRKKGPEAFLLLGHQAVVATVGTMVDGRFRVEGITLDSVSLQDRDSDVTGQLPVTGN